jgi:hypothetical protein
MFVYGIHIPVGPNEECGRNNSGHEPGSSLHQREEGTAGLKQMGKPMLIII